MFYDWFTFSGDLHRYDTCWSINDNLNILTSRTQKYGRLSIFSWNSMQNILMKHLSLKNATSKKIKYFLTKYFIEKC